MKNASPVGFTKCIEKCTPLRRVQIKQELQTHFPGSVLFISQASGLVLAMLFAIAHHLQVEPKEGLYVGDKQVDTKRRKQMRQDEHLPQRCSVRLTIRRESLCMEEDRPDGPQPLRDLV